MFTDVKWIPKNPIRSDVSPRVDATSYGSDVLLTEDGTLSFDDGDLATVSGVESFKQSFRTLILPEGNERFDYAVISRIFKPLDENDFLAESERLANQIAQHSVYDAVTGKQIGLGHTVEQVHSIERKNENGKNFLYIEVTATGVEQPLLVKLPFLPY
ncbi:hypothetical protein [Alicyclobacillus suci]|uniref:hypothetical protein n=1 Tax=Alicyclobacillus suci TaxID=2816080 RepID=UPI001A8C552B|nr:hypothetical protein [Alicyclobacillus suci]